MHRAGMQGPRHQGSWGLRIVSEDNQLHFVGKLTLRDDVSCQDKMVATLPEADFFQQFLQLLPTSMNVSDNHQSSLALGQVLAVEIPHLHQIREAGRNALDRHHLGGKIHVGLLLPVCSDLGPYVHAPGDEENYGGEGVDDEIALQSPWYAIGRLCDNGAPLGVQQGVSLVVGVEGVFLVGDIEVVVVQSVYERTAGVVA